MHDAARRPTIEAVTSGRRRGRALAVLLAVALIATARPVAAVVRDAPCTGPSHWRLRVVPDANVLRVRLTVRGGRAAQRWNIFINNNGTGFFAGHRIYPVRPEPGSCAGAVPNLAGIDRIRFGAHNVATGETCSGGAAV